jgi:MFS family permease|tara:strand:+ start:2907 stop:4124 length:1218 start_codon:yes stop_codon:yes gene_type:complete
VKPTSFDRSSVEVGLSPSQDQLDQRKGWYVTGAAAIANFVTFGILFSFGVFLTPIADTFGTSSGPVAPLFSAAICFYYLFGVIGGRISDRVGLRPVVAAGTIMLTTGLFISSQATSLWHLYVFFAPLVGGAVGCCYPPMIGTVGLWFKKERTFAISLVLTGVGVGTLFVPVISRLLIDRWDWQVALGTYAVIGGIILTCCVFVCSTPSTGAQSVQLPLRQIISSPKFRLLYAAVVLLGPGFYAPLAFYNDHATKAGISSHYAALLVGLIGGSKVVAQLFAGSFGNRFNGMRQYQLGQVLIVFGLTTWLVAGSSYALFALSALLHGAGWAIFVTATPTILAQWFGVENLAGTLGMFYTGLGIGALAGPAVLGFVIDAVNYEAAISVVIVTSAIAALISLFPERTNN